VTKIEEHGPSNNWGEKVLDNSGEYWDYKTDNPLISIGPPIKSEESEADLSTDKYNSSSSENKGGDSLVQSSGSTSNNVGSAESTEIPPRAGSSGSDGSVGSTSKESGLRESIDVNNVNSSDNNSKFESSSADKYLPSENKDSHIIHRVDSKGGLTETNGELINAENGSESSGGILSNIIEFILNNLS